MVKKEIIESMISEIRRGSIVLCVLSRLSIPKYGYFLLTELEDKGLAIDAGTLYPLLRRLEKQGLLTSSWDTDGTKPRKYYRLNDDGAEAYETLKKSWKELSSTVSGMLYGEVENGNDR